MRAPETVDTTQAARRLRDKGVLIEPGQAFFAGDHKPSNFYRLAYSSIPSNRIKQGIGLLAQDLKG
jgi:GntR family transcriptional regulator/MocR family aminotransferase